jgi:transposase-like protein
MRGVVWHAETLPRRQQRVLAEIGPFLTERGFYLAGGTAVALHFGHRRSVDLDWFAPEFPDPERLADELQKQGIPFATESLAPGTLHGIVRGVKVTFLRYRYRMLAKPRANPFGFRVAGRTDLAAMKLLAVAQRGAKKDFVDIYALSKKSDSLRHMLAWYQKKYVVEDVAHLLRSLAYFDDADKERMPKMLWEVSWRTVKSTIRRWLRDVDGLD